MTSLKYQFVPIHPRFDQWGVVPTPFWTQHNRRSPWLRACPDCMPDGMYFDCLCWQRVTGLNLFMSLPIHLQYGLQLMATKDSSFQKNYIANKTDWSYQKRMVWSCQSDNSIWTWCLDQSWTSKDLPNQFFLHHHPASSCHHPNVDMPCFHINTFSMKGEDLPLNTSHPNHSKIRLLVSKFCL